MGVVQGYLPRLDRHEFRLVFLKRGVHRLPQRQHVFFGTHFGMAELAKPVGSERHFHATGFDRRVAQPQPGRYLLVIGLKGEIGSVLVPVHKCAVAGVFGKDGRGKDTDIGADEVLDGVQDTGVVSQFVGPFEKQVRLEIGPLDQLFSLKRFGRLKCFQVMSRFGAVHHIDRVHESIVPVFGDLFPGQQPGHSCVSHRTTVIGQRRSPGSMENRPFRPGTAA